ncbi:MAG: sulfate ABC transporter permease subunit CysW [Pirellulales bacterium]
MSTVAQLPLGGVAPKGSLVETNLAGRLRLATDERAWVKGLLIGATLAFLALVLFLPLVAIFAEALRRGLAVYFASFTDANALSAIKLTLLVSVICVPLNTVFGLAAAWAIGKFQFPGKSVLITLIDLPFAVSPVISGLIFVLLFGLRGWFGPWLDAHHLQIIFATPGVVLATIFVTFPFVAREVIPLMQEQGTDEELAAVSLGASGWQTFWRVTLPNVKWAVLYGVILCNARAMGEFGAVNVVSGHVRGSTNTLPLHVEILYNEYNFAAAFAVASLLALLAVVTLAAKSAVEWRVRREFEQALEPARAEE